MIYLDGKVVPYGDEVVVTEEVFRLLRALKLSLTMDGARDLAYPAEPSPALRSFLGYLRDYRDIDISKRYRVAKGIYQLCVEFKEDYRSEFTEGYVPSSYDDDPDKFAFVRKLECLQSLADIYKSSPLEVIDERAVENES